MAESHGGAKLLTSWQPGGRARGNSVSKKCTLRRYASSNQFANWALLSNGTFSYEYQWINARMSMVPHSPVTSPGVCQVSQVDK